MESPTTPLKLLPSIALYAQDRAEQLNQSVSGYIAILIRNYDAIPARLQAEPDSRKVTRVNLGISWRRGLRAVTLRLAKGAGLTPNAFVEALIARDARSGANHLTILAVRGRMKPGLGG